MLGVAMACASSAVFHLRLYQLRNYIKQLHANLWESEGLDRNSKNPVLLYIRLQKITLEPTSDYTILMEKLATLRWLYLSTAAGLVVVFSGVIFSLAFP